MFARKLLYTFSVCYLVVCVAPAHASQIKEILTSQDPLLTKTNESGEVEGLFVDFFKAVAKHAGKNVKITQYPWKRAQQVASQGDHYIIAPMLRTPKREAKYKWVAPTFPFRIIYMTKEGGPKVTSLEQARNLKIAIKGGSASEFAARKHGIPDENKEIFSQQHHILNMLQLDRVDAWLVWDVIAHRTVQEFNKGANLVEGYTDDLGDLYLAASPTITDEEIAIWRRATEKAIADGALSEIMIKYLGQNISAR